MDEGIDWARVLGPLYCVAGITDADGLGELEAALTQHPPRCVRLSAGADAADLPFETKPSRWFERGRILLDNSIRPGGFLQHALGEYYVQDAASLLAVALADVHPGDKVLDACAAPGGKSTAIAHELGGRGFLVSNEVIASRLAPLNQALWRTGYLNYATTHFDIEDLAGPLAGQFDCVVVDAPCSGQSMLAKGKQTLASFSDHQVAHSAARQHRIMAAAESLVRPGGRLVYSTCTFAYAENEAVIEQFLGKHPWWQLPETRRDLSDFESSHLPGTYRLWPHRDPCAGGFAAALRKADDAEQSVDNSRRRQRRSAKARPSPAPPEFSQWFQPADVPLKWQEVNGKVCVSTGDAPSGLNELRCIWPPFGLQKGKRLEPSYAVSLAGCLRPVQLIELPEDAAVRYVGGQPIRLSELPEATVEQIGSKSGWAVVTHRGRRVAWTKVASGVLKNHFPKALRQDCTN
jgi:16S rRNA C967 or C1407 C5-methylase (RsmB/RsmF family)/NOL1/NOP2/fmu family ribosome biogenesis protein